MTEWSWDNIGKDLNDNDTVEIDMTYGTENSAENNDRFADPVSSEDIQGSEGSSAQVYTPVPAVAASDASARQEYSDYYDPKKRSKRVRRQSPALTITRRGFILALIACMLLTAALSVAGSALYSRHLLPSDNNATNYTLSNSKETFSYKDVVAKTQASVVSITTESMTTDSWMGSFVTQGAGSGVIVQSDGYIVTCNHVIAGASKVTVTLSNQKEYNASIVGRDASNDIAVLKINANGLTSAEYGDSSKLTVGDQVIAIGNPLGELSNTATTGIISAMDRQLNVEGQDLTLLQTDASINPGNSGGALFNSSGNLIGIVVAKSSGSDVEGLGFAIPINKAAEIAKEIIETGKSSADESAAPRVVIGINILELGDQEAMQYGFESGGVIISSVTSENARKSGLARGDMIKSVDGKNISTSDELTKVLAKHKAGDKVKIVVIRENHDYETEVVLTEYTEQE